MSSRNSRVMGLSRGDFYFFVKTTALLGVLSVLVACMGASASHGLGSHTVARTLDLGLRYVPCVLGSCVHGESFSVIRRVLLIHSCHIRSAETRELLVVSLVVSVRSVELLGNSLLPGKIISSVAHFISS